LIQFGHDPALGKRIIQRFGMDRMKRDTQCLIHAHFWPGNIVVSDHDQNAQGEIGLPLLTVIDWELARIGNGAIDVGQFMAQAWLLNMFGGGKGLLPAFISGYFQERALGGQLKKRAAVHFAVQLIYHAPSCDWISESNTEEPVEFGRDILQMIDGLKGSELKEMLEEMFADG
jgi:Ser/Thr protein kinase RdoA (MazF antagonist)